MKTSHAINAKLVFNPLATYSHNKIGFQFSLKFYEWGFPGGAVVKNLPASSGTIGSSLVLEDPTCLGVTKLVHHNYRPSALEPRNRNY